MFTRKRTHPYWLLMLVVFALIAAACGGDGEEDEGAAPGGEEGEEEAAGGGEFSLMIAEPEYLFPQNCNETGCAEVLNAVYSGLVDYDPETSQPLLGDESERAIAESIESDDQQNWTITIKDGFTFHNGDPVTAQDFVDSWNFGAYGPNAMGNSYFFENVEGYDALQCPETDAEGACQGEPEATEMSGLSAPDDTTIEVTLSAPFSQYPLTVGYTAFYASPAEVLEDWEAANEAPIGNGPYQMDGEWRHNEGIDVVRYEEYGGEPGVADAIEFRIYADPATSYTDLQAGNLDIVEDVPAAQIESARTEFGEAFIEGESSSFTYIGFPLYDDRFSNPDLRKAFSMALDREAITATIRTDSNPARAMVNPVVAGAREDACGESCAYDPEAAKELFDSAGGWEGELKLWFNNDGDHEAWMEAVANQLRQNLGISNIRFESLAFAEYLGLLDNQEVDGPFRLGWVMDYPSMQNYLEPIHGTTGSSNNTGYSNPEFDELVEQGNQAASVEEGIEFYQQAEDLLLEEMPIIPMFMGKIAGAHSDRVEGVILDAFTRINTADIVVTDA